MDLVFEKKLLIRENVIGTKVLNSTISFRSTIIDSHNVIE